MKTLCDRVNDLIAEQGYAFPCEHGHLDCALKEDGFCSDEWSPQPTEEDER
jgi:hypothetical protein